MQKSDIRRGDFVKIANGAWYEAVHRDGGIKLVGLKTSDTPIYMDELNEDLSHKNNKDYNVILVCCDNLSDFVNPSWYAV